MTIEPLALLAEIGIAIIVGLLAWGATSARKLIRKLEGHFNRLEEHIEQSAESEARVEAALEERGDVGERLDALENCVRGIKRVIDRELKPNGGTSLRDRVVAIEALMRDKK